MKKYTKLALLLAVVGVFSVSCKKEPKKEEPKKQINVTQKEVKVEEKKEEKNNEKVLMQLKDFKGKIFSNGKETITILSEEDVKDGSIAKDLGIKVKAGDMHIFKVGDTGAGKVYTDVKVEKIDGKDVITAKGLDKKFTIIDENKIKDESGSEYKKI